MSNYLYTYARHEDEQEFCSMELRALFQSDYIQSHNRQAFVSNREIASNRSPFVKERLEVVLTGSDPDELALRVADARMQAARFKVQYMKTGQDIPYAQRREAERIVGGHIRGQAEMRKPDIVFGLARLDNRWLFGLHSAGEAVWIRHSRKPQQYSTALSARVARALVNIAAPVPTTESCKLVDPCCGIGTVLLEACSLGIDVRGFDRNWQAVRGARRNLAHFGYPDVVAVADISELSGEYNAAIIDLPYNVLTKQSGAELRKMLLAARRLASRAVIVSIGSIEQALIETGWHTMDRSVLRKSSFERQVRLCVHDKDIQAGVVRS